VILRLNPMSPAVITVSVRLSVLCLVLFFALCQVAGAMCPPPQGPAPSAVAFSEPEGMSCPMPSGMACLPMLASSKERAAAQPYPVTPADQGKGALHALGTPLTPVPEPPASKSPLPRALLSFHSQTAPSVVLRI